MTTHESHKLPELIVLTGLDGSGKGHLAAHLRDNEGFLALGASDIIRHAIASQPDLEGLPLDEATRRLKGVLGPTFITDTAMERYRKSKAAYTGLAIDGLRRYPEIEQVKTLDGAVVYVNADDLGRFKQLVARGRHDAPKTRGNACTRCRAAIWRSKRQKQSEDGRNKGHGRHRCHEHL